MTMVFKWVITIVVVLTACIGSNAQKTLVDYKNVPETVSATVNKEYAEPKKIMKCEQDGKGYYRVSVDVPNKPTEVIVVLSDGKWIRKASFVEMTESDLELIMKVQDVLGSTDAIKHWTKTLFPDGTLEFRVMLPNQVIHVWDAQHNYIGVVKDPMYPATVNNLRKVKAKTS